jgi:protein gp37
MTAKSKIEWTDAVWNPVTGCTKISEGCQNCYAEKMHKRLQAINLQSLKSKKYLHLFEVIRVHLFELNKDFGKKPKMVFVNSMSDLFHERLPDGFIEDVINTCFCHTRHQFQILTKRSERLLEFNFRNIHELLPSNIWLGVSVELVKYKNRIDDLRKTNAKTKFISFEPLLGDVGELDLSGIDWVIVGGESGPGARPMHIDWVRNIRDQAIKQNVKFFFKQWGEFQDGSTMGHSPKKEYIVLKNGDFLKFSEKHPKDYLREKRGCLDEAFWRKNSPRAVSKVGKKKAGRELDGRLWDEMPEGENA